LGASEGLEGVVFLGLPSWLLMRMLGGGFQVCEGVVIEIVLSVEIDMREGIEDAVVSERVGSGVRGFSGREAGFSAWGWGPPLQRQAS